MISLSFREQLPKVVADELDSLMTRIQRLLDVDTSSSATPTTLAEINAEILALQTGLAALQTSAERLAHKSAAGGYPALDSNTRVVQRLAPTTSPNSTTGAQNNVNFSAADTIVFSNAALTTLSGLVAGYTGQQVLLISTGGGNVALLHQSGLSSAGNKFKNVTAGTITLTAGTGRAAYWYDGTDWLQLWAV